MRLSADKNSPDYDWLLIRSVLVFLDGERLLRDCFEAYEEAGMVRVLVRDGTGRVVLDRKNKTVQQTQRYGKVEITLREGACAEARRRYEQKRRSERV